MTENGDVCGWLEEAHHSRQACERYKKTGSLAKVRIDTVSIYGVAASAGRIIQKHNPCTVPVCSDHHVLCA